jgi:hypothetical protein
MCIGTTGGIEWLLVGVVWREGSANGTGWLHLVVGEAFAEPQNLPIVVFILKHRNDHKNYIKLQRTGDIRLLIYFVCSWVWAKGAERKGVGVVG